MIRLSVLVNHIRADQTRSSMNGGRDRDNDFSYAQIARISAGMYRAGAPESKKDKVPRIMSFLYGRLPDQVTHVRISYSVDAASRLDLVHTEGLGDLLTDGLQRGLFIEPHPAAQEVVFIQIT